MRIVIAGAGEVGTHLAKMLSRENHDIVVIDSDGKKLEIISSSYDLQTFEGKVTSLKLLEEAGVGNADLFVAVTPSEDTNIVAASLAKKLGAELTIVRISSNEPLNKETRNIFSGLGIDSMIYPEKIAAKEIISVLHQSGVANLIDFSGGKLSLLAVRMDKNAPIVNKTPSEAGNIYQMEYRAVAILRDGKTIIPYGDVKYEPDDTLYVVTNHAGIKSILQHSGQSQHELKQVMILGGSHIGRLIAKELGKNYSIKIIEADRDEAYRLSDILDNALVIHGDGTKIDLLLDEGLKTTDAFLAVSSDSEANILACMLAKSEGVRHTVAEIENLDYINLAERMGIDTIVNKKLIAASHIYRYTLSRKVSMLKYLAGTDAEVLEYEATEKSKIVQHAIRDLNFPKNAIIGGLIRGKSGFIATGSTQIQPGDRVVVFSMPSAINEVSYFF